MHEQGLRVDNLAIPSVVQGQHCILVTDAAGPGNLLAWIPTDGSRANGFGPVGSSEAGFSGVDCVQGVSLLLH
jgi:hypothetical protein